MLSTARDNLSIWNPFIFLGAIPDSDSFQRNDQHVATYLVQTSLVNLWDDFLLSRLKNKSWIIQCFLCEISSSKVVFQTSQKWHSFGGCLQLWYLPHMDLGIPNKDITCGTRPQWYRCHSKPGSFSTFGVGLRVETTWNASLWGEGSLRYGCCGIPIVRCA